jgi:hypothetical protein
MVLQTIAFSHSATYTFINQDTFFYQIAVS